MARYAGKHVADRWYTGVQAKDVLLTVAAVGFTGAFLAGVLVADREVAAGRFIPDTTSPAATTATTPGTTPTSSPTTSPTTSGPPASVPRVPATTGTPPRGALPALTVLAGPPGPVGPPGPPGATPTFPPTTLAPTTTAPPPPPAATTATCVTPPSASHPKTGPGRPCVPGKPAR